VPKKKKREILYNIAVTDYAAEGKAIGRYEGKVLFIQGAVPGDVVDLLIVKSKKDWAEAKVINLVELSPDRVIPFCKHFGVCGGCKWQMLPYHKQLEYKQREAGENLRRIGKTDLPPVLPIIGSVKTVFYRNKLEFTFSNKRYLLALPASNDRDAVVNDHSPVSDKNTPDAIKPPSLPVGEDGALGYHVPRLFDKVLDIQECWLMDDVNNLIRNTIRSFSELNNFSYYDIRAHTGWLRNVIVRYCTSGELMVNICLNYDAEDDRNRLLEHLLKEVPSITTLLYTINPKWNDTIYDLSPQVYHGKGYLTEKLEDFEFIISPKSFFQTNTLQAERLYQVTREFAGLTGNEIVYDLYCGTGSIGIFLSKGAKKIIGVEAIEEAIEDAKKNAAINNIQHAHFFAGDVIKICDDAFFETNGRPDVIITDPPRAGMHEKLVLKLLDIEAPTIVYVSCNTATQARDIHLLSEKYDVVKIQPLDMFPHTHHIECVVLLKLK
jgi:23S rRNA (uracil1939-C5)-methyltransferase